MTYDECKKIIRRSLDDYCSKGGSLLKIALNFYEKEYIFEFEEEYTEDDRKYLMDMAYKAMERGKDLPNGIRLSKVIFTKNKKK